MQGYRPYGSASSVTEHIVYIVKTKIRWNVGLCDCCASNSDSSTSTCIKGCFCPCFLFPEIDAKLEKRSSKINCVQCLFCCCCVRAGYRRKVRQAYTLPAEPCNDCCVVCFCPCCSLMQEVNELNSDHLFPRQQIMR